MENQNSVCYVATIKEVRAIEGADNIELVIAGGWNAIAFIFAPIAGSDLMVIQFRLNFCQE